MKLIQKSFYVLFIFIGILAVVNFVINIRVILILNHSFRTHTNWCQDFENVARFMAAKAILSDLKIINFADSDFYKLTQLYVITNNLIVISLSVIEVFLIRHLDWLRKIPELAEILRIFFTGMAMITPFILLLSTL